MSKFPYESYQKHPACPRSVGYNALIMKDGRVVAEGRASVYYAGVVTLYYDAETMGVFKDDPVVAALGSHAAFRFWSSTGEPADSAYTDVDESKRLEGYSIVDKTEFTFGYAAKERYGNVPGFGVHREDDPKHYKNFM